MFAGTLFSQTDVLVESNESGPRHTEFDFATPLSAQLRVIEIDFSNITSGIQDNIGIDNISFGQNPPALIPIPAAAWLLGSGLL